MLAWLNPKTLYRKRLTEFYEGGRGSAHDETVRALLILKLTGLGVVYIADCFLLIAFAVVPRSHSNAGPFLFQLFLVLSALFAVVCYPIVRELRWLSPRAWKLAESRIPGNFAAFVTAFMWVSFLTTWLSCKIFWCSCLCGSLG